MSKIGRKPINVDDVQIKIDGQTISYKGKGGEGVHVLPDVLCASLEDSKLKIMPRESHKDSNNVWGLHRALLANEIEGVRKGFEKQLKIIGLGYKAALTGNKVVFSLGFSHKINFDLPKAVSLSIDKTGQTLTFKSADKALLGEVCDKVRALRPPEPYKGTGIKYTSEEIVRKAGKTKASS